MLTAGVKKIYTKLCFQVLVTSVVISGPILILNGV